MVSKTKFKYEPSEKQPEQKLNDTGKHQCEVFGCPRLATIKTNHWNCRYHNLRSGDSLDGITLILKNHEREINWHEKVMNMAYHEYDIMKGNAPENMRHLVNEDLIKYRVRMQQYITTLFKHPARLKIPVTKTYLSLSEVHDD